VSFTNNQVNFPVANASASILADERHQEKNKAIKLTDSVKNYISEKLKEYWSPEQIMGRLEFVSFTNNQVNFPVANASASINNTGALINVNAIRYPTLIIIFAIAFYGREFSWHEKLAENLDCDTYFAKPYHSWERGLNENHNGLLRQFFPKRESHLCVLYQ
jgi:IS30 family transposase